MTLTIHHMRNLPLKVRRRFTSDIGFVADYLNEGTLAGRSGQRIVHVEALCRMMEALTGDTRFTEQLEALLEQEAAGKEIHMCEYIDMLEARGEKRGFEIGQKHGIEIGQKHGIEIGQMAGRETGENCLAKLIQFLVRDGRDQEIAVVAADRERRHELYRAYNIT